MIEQINFKKYRYTFSTQGDTGNLKQWMNTEH